jgi:hypothetical protein
VGARDGGVEIVDFEPKQDAVSNPAEESPMGP